jgi:hypothetical protein
VTGEKDDYAVIEVRIRAGKVQERAHNLLARCGFIRY